MGRRIDFFVCRDMEIRVYEYVYEYAQETRQRRTPTYSYTYSYTPVSPSSVILLLFPG